MTPPAPDPMHRLRTGYLRLRSALRDPVTGLFALSVHLDAVRALLADRTRVGVLWIAPLPDALVEEMYGWERYDRLLDAAAHEVADLRASLATPTVLAVPEVHADRFVLVVAGDEGAGIDARALEDVAADAVRRIDARLASELAPHGPLRGYEGRTGARAGLALLEDHPFQRFERRLWAAVDEARAAAQRESALERLDDLSELQRILRERALDVALQPIVDLASGRAEGVEAFARGPLGSTLRASRRLVQCAEETGCAAELDRAAHALAVTRVAGALPGRGLLFLNVSPERLTDATWRDRDWLERLAASGLAPDRVVLEVREARLGADPRAYRDALAPARALGYALSIDDIGSGGRTLAVLEALRPEYVKFDLALVRGFIGHPIREELVRSVAALARRAGARLVAERVESEAERDGLVECGVPWAQGHWFDDAAAAARATADADPAIAENAR